MQNVKTENDRLQEIVSMPKLKSGSEKGSNKIQRKIVIYY